MKKPIALVLSAALLTLPVSPAVAFGDTLTETTTVSTTTDAETTDAESTDSDTITDADADSEATQEDSSATAETDETTGEDSTVDEDTSIDEEGNVVDSDGEVVNPGTLPDSPLYWLDELVEKLQVALAFSPEKKIKLMEKQACERLAEALAIAQKVSDEEAATDTAADVPDAEENTENAEDVNAENTENSDTEVTNEEDTTTTEDEEATVTQPTSPKIEKNIKAFEKALKGYDAKIAHAQEFLAEIQDPESEKAQKLQEALTKVNANNVIVLGSLLEKLPPQAAQRVAVNIVRSMEKAIEKMEKMEAKNAEPVQEESEQSDVVEQEDVAKDDENVSTTPSESLDTAKTDEKTVVPTKTLEKYAAKNQLTKSEYKELRKEAHEALKELQEDLGLKGPQKIKDSDSEDWKKVDDKKVDRDRDDNRGKNSEKGDKSKSNNGKHD